MMRRGLWAMALLALGCGSDPPVAEPTCETLGCPAGSSCREGLCLADEPDDYRIAVRFVPADNVAAAQWTELLRLSEQGDSLPYKFRDALTVGGSVTNAGLPVAARVELSRGVPLPGRAPLVHGRSVGAGSQFEITVPEDDYRLTVWSVDPTASFPPIRQDVPAAALSERLDVAVPDTVGLTGSVTRNDTTVLPNVRVWCVDPVTREVVSTIGRTGDQGAGDGMGRFRVVVPVSVGEFVVRLAESDQAWARALPTIETQPIQVANLGFDPEDRSYEVSSSLLVYPVTSWVQLSGTVEGRPRAGGRVTVGNALLRFFSTDLGAPGLPDALGTMDRLTHADRDGAFRVELPGGTYDVEITPPESTEVLDLGVGVVSQFVNAAPEDPFQSGIVLEAPQRLTLGGTVRDAEGQRIEAAVVELRGGGELADRTLAAAENGVRSVTARTTREGAFLALVDGGHFDAVVRPPEDAGLPWGVQLGLAVAEDGTLAEPVVLAPGRRVTGVVLDQDGAPAPDVRVEVWCVTELGASVECARARTGPQGRYAVLLPASLGEEPPAAPAE